MTRRVDQGVGRRAALKLAARGLAACALAPFARIVRAAPARESLGGGFELITGVGGNVLVRSSAGGQVLVDGGAAEHAGMLADALAELPGAGRVEALFNTHWHLDQVGSNAALGRAGTPIVAHEKTRLRLSTPYYLPAEERYQPPLPAEARPTESFYTQGSIELLGEQVDYGYLLEAHTDGDAYVYFRGANVIAVGDAVSPQRDPALDWFGGGWLGGRLEALALLLDLTDRDTRFVPSYGPVVGRTAVEAEHELMSTIFERMFEMIRQGMSAEDMLVAGVLEDLDRRFDTPFEFVHAAHKGLWAHHNKLSHDIV